MGQADDDRVRGREGNDRVSGGSGYDIVSGQSGNDFLTGAAGNDRLLAGPGNDVISGGSGEDQFDGRSGRDSMRARDGAVDRIRCGSGKDNVQADHFDKVNEDCESVSRGLLPDPEPTPGPLPTSTPTPTPTATVTATPTPTPTATATPTPLPNLVIDSATGSQAVIRNAGSVAAGAFSMKVTVGSSGDSQQVRLSGLQPGSTFTFNYECRRFETRTITVDVLNEVNESNEADNTQQFGSACGSGGRR